jgi:hypothetical protein
MIFLGKLFIYVGYGIIKKKSEKLFWECFKFKEKEKWLFSFLIDWKLMYTVRTFLKLKSKKNSSLEPFLKNISQVNNAQSFKNVPLD